MDNNNPKPDSKPNQVRANPFSSKPKQPRVNPFSSQAKRAFTQTKVTPATQATTEAPKKTPTQAQQQTGSSQTRTNDQLKQPDQSKKPTQEPESPQIPSNQSSTHAQSRGTVTAKNPAGPQSENENLQTSQPSGLRTVANNPTANSDNSQPKTTTTHTQNKNKLARNNVDQRQADRRVSDDRRLNEYRLTPGEFIFKEGDKSEFGYVVVSGTIEICKLINGEFKILSEITEGALFGEMAIIDSGERSASARAKDDALVKEIDEAALKSYFTRSPDVALDMMRRLSAYVRSSNQALEVSVFDAPDTNKTDDTSETEQTDRSKLLAKSKDNQYVIDEFQEPSEAFIKTRMPPVIFKTFLTIALMFCVFLGWSVLSIIDTTLSVPGKLTTTVPKITVQAGSGGMVKSVLVTPGQEVKKGDVLATVDNTIVEADYNKLKKRNDHLDAKIQRLQLEITNAPLKAASQLSSKSEQEVYRLRWEEHNAKLKTFELELHKSKSALKTAQSNINISKIKLQEVEHAYNKQKRLVSEGIVSETALNEAQFNVDKSKAELNKSFEAVDVAKSNYEAKLMESKTYQSGRIQKINDELFASLQQMESEAEDLVKIEHQRVSSEIISPVDGVVLETEGMFVGAIVGVGQVVTTLVPTNVPLTVEMDIDPKNIGNLSLGNEVSLKLSALPYQKHGDLTGKITFVSEDTVDKSITGEQGTFYRARADIVSNNLVKLPPDFNLVPGMQLNGDVRVGKRRIITYFLYPVIRTIETSFQEP